MDTAKSRIDLSTKVRMLQGWQCLSRDVAVAKSRTGLSIIRVPTMQGQGG